MELTIDQLHNLCNDETIVMTQHVVHRCGERGINYEDIKRAILTGEIIEQYPDDYPHPSCLVLGVTVRESLIHIVCGFAADSLWIITAYYPDENKWETGFKTRKKV